MDEYRVEVVSWDGRKQGAEHLEKTLNEFAADGWTVVSVIPTHGRVGEVDHGRVGLGRHDRARCRTASPGWRRQLIGAETSFRFFLSPVP